ncbi:MULTISPECIES: citrate synthase [unclassified Ensifer]|uniref:citrate synthase n=1 Tax=unclassified Ensifer TaxID=2633371 RepID=UPI000812EB5C|nr:MULTISPECIES: citrate synthase [unclassified Ensifer]OCP00225.1 citrate synthase [Ensifer sp. LC11]OCP00387.1 citrate synthase [Ensifer sp. LC13]OCP04155.1 citrate synthase [Ensifer sp. LC14]OCP31423.1 citrate synthase [Ensifer sp. LC499]
MKTLWITADEALARLGSKRQTLYANVSRGRIRAKPDPSDPRRSLYQADDVQRLAERHAGRRQAAVVAAEAIRWGEPVLPTTISNIAGGRLFYRGHDAVELSAKATLEEVAALLWQSPETISVPAVSDHDSSQSRQAATFRLLAGRIERDLPALGRRPAILKVEAAEVLATVATGLAPSRELVPLHQRLALGWKRPEAAEPIRKCLVLTAEHELNVSAFAARVTASSGAALSAATLSGLATLTGPRHGGAWLSVTRLAEQAASVGVREAIRGMLSSEGVVRAFGHRLYPDGDPRAKAIMASFKVPELYAALAEAGEDLLGEPANLDFSLAALAARFDLPEDAPLVIFALARTVGWLAHAMEQVQSGELIRPRAHYTGS